MPKDEKGTARHPLASGLGWFALGLGAVELVAPRRLSRWLAPRPRLTIALLTVGAVSVLDAIAFGVGRKARRGRAQPKARQAITAAITIDRSAAEIYAFCRDVENLPRFVTHLESVTTTDQIRSHWRAKVPHGPSLEWDAVIVEDRPEQRILWKVQGSKLGRIVESGELRLEPAPGGQGTEVHLTLWTEQVPSLMRWLRKLPERFWSAQLHRLKQLLELGELTVSDASPFAGPHPARPAEEELTSAPLASSAAPTPGPTVAEVEERRPS